jgi:hypothetical protein
MGNSPRLLGLGVLGLAGGALLVVLLWLVLVPWDLSEVDQFDRLRAEGLQNTWPRVVLVGAAAAVVGAVVTARQPPVGGALLTGAFLAMAVLFVGRTRAATTRGANFWFVGIVLWLPPMALGLAAGYGLGVLYRQRKSGPHRSPPR